MNDLGVYRDAFKDFKPWRGCVPEGFVVNYWGILTNKSFLFDLDQQEVEEARTNPRPPSLGDGMNGEVWFEAINWLAAAQDARRRYIMMTLGANYGAQAVGAYRMLQLVNPMPCTLVAVEAEPGNFAWIFDHMRDNGIDPAAHWLVPMAVSDSNQPVLFPVGAPGTGSNNCVGTNAQESRKIYADLIIRDGDPDVALRNLFISNSTGLTQPVHPGLTEMTEVKFVSAITLTDLLGPFDIVDFLEADIQQSEIIVFPPCIRLLRKKVRRIHIGTHSKAVHRSLHDLFAENRWNIVFSFEPNARHSSALGDFTLNDGVLTVKNPDL